MASPRVLIVGGGYVGMYTALGLLKRVPPGSLDVTVVAPESFMLYQPLLPEAASGNIEPRHVVIPLRRVLRQASIVTGRLEGLDHAARSATVRPIDGRPGGIWVSPPMARSSARLGGWWRSRTRRRSAGRWPGCSRCGRR
ncbi:MAG: hypothetical protein ACRDKA_11430 [Actinomycetota bacterium]